MIEISREDFSRVIRIIKRLKKEKRYLPILFIGVTHMKYILSFCVEKKNARARR